MAALQLALVLLATVLASAVIDQLVPHVSLPLIQIACGVVAGLIARGQISIALDPELFLVLFVAPLLFNEARAANNLQLWKNRGTMLSFAIGLVVAIVLVIGFLVNWLIPSIPLAAAFALGAALGPTDPVAVASVSKQADIPPRQKTALQGESLLNDASGIVSFEFAVAAVVTGSFSIVDAVGSFCIEFFGALVIGVLLGYIVAKLTNMVRDWGLENTTFHVAVELLMPFIAYLLGVSIGVSGVILVVACGITMTFVPRSFAPSMSRLNIVSSSVWKVLEFALNGIVFVLLGMQLPQAFFEEWAESGITNWNLALYIVVITLALYAIRFIWSLVSELLVGRRTREKATGKERMRSAAVMTFSGAKGAITLAIMLSLPLYVSHGWDIQEFPSRDMLIFLASGVILLSLVIATFAVPLLAPRKDDEPARREKDNESKADILRGVIEALTARQTPENTAAYAPLIAQYTDRLERFKGEEDLEDESDTELRITAIEWEQEYVLHLIEDDEVPPYEGYQFVSRLARVQSMLKHGKHRSLQVSRWARRTRLFLKKMRRKVRKDLPGERPLESKQSAQVMREIQILATEHVIEKLEETIDTDRFQSEKVSNLIAEYQRTLALLKGPAPSITAMAQLAEPDLEATRFALRTELNLVQQAYDDGCLSRQAAQRMRENVYLMQLDLEDHV